MLRGFLWVGVLFLSQISYAVPVCVEAKGASPYWVYETSNKLFLGTSGYYTDAFCRKAVATTDLRIVCAPMAIQGKGGSALISTADGTIVGYKNFYTSVKYCSTAIESASGGTICIPGPVAGEVTLFDFIKGQVIGHSFSSIDLCKYASLSASQDPYVCAMNYRGFTQVVNRASGQWIKYREFHEAQECYQYLNDHRKQVKAKESYVIPTAKLSVCGE